MSFFILGTHLDASARTCKVAKNADEAKDLVEVGFEYVYTIPENTMLF